MVTRNRCVYRLVTVPGSPLNCRDVRTLRYLAWPALVLSFNTVINQHSLRTKDGGTSPITSVLCVSPSSVRLFPRTDMMFLMPQCCAVCSGHCLPPPRHSRASKSPQSSAATWAGLIEVALVCYVSVFLRIDYAVDISFHHGLHPHATRMAARGRIRVRALASDLVNGECTYVRRSLAIDPSPRISCDVSRSSSLFSERDAYQPTGGRKRDRLQRSTAEGVFRMAAVRVCVAS